MRVAQFGCGNWGKNLLRVASGLDGVAVRAVADPSADVQSFVQSTYPGVEVRDRADGLIDDDRIDAVIIAAPAADHFELAKEALSAGKHVFVEKPVALTSAGAEELAELSENVGRTLMVGHTFLYNAAVRKVKELMDNGELGDIYYISARRINLGTVRSDVNVVWNLAPHDVSILLYWLGSSPTRVDGSAKAFLQPGIEDVGLFSLEFPGNTLAHIELSWLNPLKVRQMVIVGSERMVVYDDVAPNKIVIYDRGFDLLPPEADAPEWTSFGEFQLIRRQGDIRIPFLKFPEPLEVELQHFRDCVQDGSRPLTDGWHGLEVVRVLERMDAAGGRAASP